ncbi:hypothetical protein PR003_g2144 [Phytophthora rubi]|uniref:Uncharacterized protein n=1 Tax=Phytophthora rubi TaxID=129364 RepID=A0A6A4FTI7_9STRA|nr:hypothetical protein PR002_g1045 [Phytophthora rubi]KAE9050050.1 hypothetical protein PR001_g2747 [Phytophthora rubi]KAE9356795.1 hypothetical protein PR003_g2144 [Phytophthora rubi]
MMMIKARTFINNLDEKSSDRSKVAFAACSEDHCSTVNGLCWKANEWI